MENRIGSLDLTLVDVNLERQFEALIAKPFRSGKGGHTLPFFPPLARLPGSLQCDERPEMKVKTEERNFGLDSFQWDLQTRAEVEDSIFIAKSIQL